MHGHKRAKVAVGLVVYNGERYLGQAVDSILAQTFTDFELILSDNASTDRTGEICREYARRDRRVRYIRRPVNLGVAGNFNETFRASDSDYFRWAADDDVMAPTYLERCVELLDADPTVAAAHSMWRVIDENGSLIRLEPPWRELPSASAATRYRAIVTGREYAIWAVMRSDMVRRTRLHASYPSSETAFQAEMVLMGRFAMTEERLFDVRSHPDCYTRRPLTAQEHQEWWGQKKFKSIYLLAPIGFCDQGVAVWRSPLPWSQKVLCWRHLLDCVREYGSAIVQHNVSRASRIAARLGGLISRRRAGQPGRSCYGKKENHYDVSV